MHVEMSPDEIARFGADPAETFRRNYASVRERVDVACARAGRRPEAVRILPISKTVPAHMLRYAVVAGLHCFGENKIQEGSGKADELRDLEITWSAVGHLQTNKVRQMVDFATEFQALDSLRLAEIIHRRLEIEDRSLDVYVQVNTSGEASKYGIAPASLPPFLDALAVLPRLRPRGLMTLAQFSADHAAIRSCFALLKRLRDQAVRNYPAIRELSMGMSGDFELAIAEGADIVRIGEAIFGKRSTPDGHYWPGLAGSRVQGGW